MKKWIPNTFLLDYEVFILVAYVLRKRNIFYTLSRKWITNGTVDKVGGPLNFEAFVDLPECVTGSIFPVIALRSSPNMPRILAETILTQRKTAINSRVGLIYRVPLIPSRSLDPTS